MSRYVSISGAILLLFTTYCTIFLMAMETCEHGTAEFLYTAFVKIGYLNLIALFLLYLGYQNKGNLTIAVVATSLLGMSWIVVDGFLIFEQVMLRGMAPCYGYYLEDGDYGSIVYFYGPYFLFVYLTLLVTLMYQYIIKLDVTYKLKRF